MSSTSSRRVPHVEIKDGDDLSRETWRRDGYYWKEEAPACMPLS